MNESRIQQYLDAQNINLQEVSDRSGLSIESIQTIESRINEDFANLQKLSEVLNIAIPKLLEIIGKASVQSNPPEWYCKTFPDAEICKKLLKKE
ncbi:MAG: helix-turn-helix transcriptional regulator [Leptolyngbya sp. UWPOB_LEPTO1]|uniref:helix-turn-helix domain-containing protein n=1 Tax=Leptolyngbya sp. UWPOB_LEPTO1 TaxID=2815653 RepID=UPI001ACB4043|nr:helix-turn-helix transcriptional regulator [Leptolyngbya sp. UWPOB_LEPTO1]MBN8563753.1 helix-turn-helix transcriptional regulator [Leptolyngbya sp. UWPOB_LEPTO1]